VAEAPILIATSNRGKLREIAAILADLPVRLTGLDDYGRLPPPVEDADTFEENAAKKALHYARLTGLWALADDSGLVVDVLGGAPGVLSARYAGRSGDDHANNAKLIQALAGVPLEKRTARFRCAMALARDEQVVASAAGSVDGLIVDEPAGENGFGYDPHFFVPAYGMTTAEMSPDLKNRISHRGHALRFMRGHIERLLSQRLSRA